MYRPTSVKLFEPKNPEYSLADAMTTEQYTIHSPEIKYWSFVKDGPTAATLDELDVVYGEKSSKANSGRLVYTGPYNVKGFLEIEPILQELLKMGPQQIEVVELFVNIAAMENYLENRLPKRGDIFRVTWIVTETVRRYIWYSVANVTPVDPYNFKYVNWHINAEQTLMKDAPENIRQYMIGE